MVKIKQNLTSPNFVAILKFKQSGLAVDIANRSSLIMVHIVCWVLEEN